MNRATKIAAIAALALGLTGCAREFDVDGVGATQIPGSGGIYRFCDGPTLIYFTSRTGTEDEIEAIWPDMCWPDDGGRWVYSTDPKDYDDDTDNPRTNGNVDDGGDR